MVQIGNQKTTADSLPNQDKYNAFLSGQVDSKKGISGLKLGDSKEKMFQILGLNKTYKSLKDRDIYYYGPNTTEIVITLAPPNTGVIRRIEVNYRFRGQTTGGAKIGDSREKVKSSYPGALATDSALFSVYCDGTTFFFSNDRLKSISLVELDFDAFKTARIKKCKAQ